MSMETTRGADCEHRPWNSRCFARQRCLNYRVHWQIAPLADRSCREVASHPATDFRTKTNKGMRPLLYWSVNAKESFYCEED